MRKLKQSLAVLFLFVFAFCGILAGCNDKYKNLKVTCDRAQEGITLFVGEDQLDQTEVVFDVTGAGEEVSTKLSFSFVKNEETRIVDIVDKTVDGTQTSLTLKAIAGGETTLVALTEEGGKSCSVKINCVVRATDMQLNSNYKALVIAGGDPLVLDTTQILKFTPADTTQNNVEYYLKSAIEHVSLTTNGLLTVERDANISSLTIVAKNKDNTSLPEVEFDVQVVKYIQKEDIVLQNKKGDVLSALTLVTNREAESQANVLVDVNTTEDYSLNYYIANSNGEISTSVNSAEIISKKASEVLIGAIDVGNCSLVVEVIVGGFSVQSVVLPIEVIEIASNVKVNGNSENFAQNIYTKYNNGIGQEFSVQVGSEFANDKRFVIVVNSEDMSNIKIVKADGREIIPYTNDNANLNYDILSNNTKFYVTGIEINNQTTISVVAFGTMQYSNPAKVDVVLTTLLGAETIEPTFVDETIKEKTVFVQEGSFVELEYVTDNQNASTKGLLLQTIGTSDCFEYSVQDTENPVVTITGVKEGSASVKFVLPNQVESQVFTIVVYKTLQDILASVESPLESKNIAVAKYNGKQLESFVMSLGVGTQIMLQQNPSDGTLFELQCTSTNQEVVTVSKNGYVVSRGIGNATIQIEAKTLENQNGKNVIKTISHSVDVTVYVPIRSIRLSDSVLTLSYKEALNKTLFDEGAYKTTLSLNLYPNSVNLEDENLSIYWTTSNGEKLKLQNVAGDELTKEIVASMGDNDFGDSLEYIEVFVSYYGTTFSQKCLVNVIRPVRAQGTIVTIDDGRYDTIYFDGRYNLSIFNGSLDANGVTPVKINTTVYPSNTTDKTVTYSGYNKSIVHVTNDGYVYPLAVGTTEITVQAQDAKKQNDDPMFEAKVIKVVVADGRTVDTALRIQNQNDLANIDLNLHYYLANNISLTSALALGNLSGSIDGRNHSLYNMHFGTAQHALFQEVSGSISNLSITANVNIQNATNEVNASVVALKNSGEILNVNVVLSNFEVTNDSANSIILSGLVLENNGEISGCSVNGNIVVSGNDCSDLYVGMIVAINNGKMLGQNNNYSYSKNKVISFSATGNIQIDIASTNSAVGGVVATNNGTIGSVNNGIILGKGFAVDTAIYAPQLQNVGGVAGINTASIQNALIYANITANKNVGGLVGQNNGENAVVSTSIVELYQSVFNQELYFGIFGTENIGGLVGQNNSASIQNSYIYAYNNGCKVGSDISVNVGGIAGYDKNGQISISSANAYLQGSNVGGIVGLANSTTIQNCYSRGGIIATENAGKFVGYVETTSAVANSYSTILDNQISDTSNVFVGAVAEQQALNVSNSYHLSYVSQEEDASARLESELKDISTFVDWSISTGLMDNSVWYIKSTYNEGYPTLRFEGYVQAKKQATEISVQIIDNVGYFNASHNILVLNTNTQYLLSELVNISTDSDDAQRFVVISNVNNVLSETNYSEQTTTISSQTETYAEITFMLYSNISLSQTIKVLFVNSIDHFEFGNNTIQVKIGTSDKINAFIFDQKGTLLNAKDYYLGMNIINFEDFETYFSISNSQQVGNVLFFQSAEVLTAKQAVSLQNLGVNLYKKANINGTDAFVQILDEEKQVNINIVLTNGATEISVDKKSIDLSVINTINFSVIVATDNANDVLIVREIAEDIAKTYINISINGQTIIATNPILSLVNTSSTFDETLGQKTFQFQIQFLDEYKTGANFATKLLTSIIFSVESNQTLEAPVQVTAMPQNVLKIDMLHFPAGKQITSQTSEGTKVLYNATETPSNTLTPGQIGLLVIDMYPSYAYVDELQITTSIDAQGNYISFIQVAEYDYSNTIDNSLNREYIELKPNPEIISNGIILSKQSAFYNDGTYSYNGAIYVKTLIGSNVPNQEVFTITISAIIYDRDAQGNIIYGQDGKPATKIVGFTKSIEIVVSPNPDILLQVQNPVQKFINVGIEGQTQLAERNVVARGTSVDINATIKNFSSNVNYVIDVTNNSKNDVTFETSYINTLSQKSKLYVGQNVPAGTVIEITAYATKTINGMEEYYYSQKIQLYVVDYILEDVVLANSSNSIVIGNNETQKLDAMVIAKYNENITEVATKVETLQNQLNTNTSYWLSILGQTETSWNSGASIYNGLYSVSTADDVIKLSAKGVGSAQFKTLFKYHYDYVNTNASGVALGLVINNNIDSQSYFEKTFTIETVSTTTLDKPIKIENLNQFYQMTPDNDYILMTNLTLNGHIPSELTAKSFDGNCHTITINSFGYSGQQTEYMGLFSQISENIIVKNVFIEYNITGDIGTQNTSSIVFGGLTAQNSGIISNCKVTYNNVEQNNQINFLGQNNQIGGFVGINDGIITYSIAQGKTAYKNGTVDSINNFFLTSTGNIAGFVCANSQIISNSKVEYLGIENTTSENISSITAGFVGTNSGKINSSSVTGQLLEDGSVSSTQRVKSLGKNDSRVVGTNTNFARLVSKGNIAGFVYSNSGTIRDTYTNIPMDSQSRTSGYVFTNTQAGVIYTSYTVSYYDGKQDYADNTAHTPFIGTNELGEVLNESETIKYCYYINNTKYIDEDETFKQYASNISLDASTSITSYVGFDHSSSNKSVWTNGSATDTSKAVVLPVIRAIEDNDKISNLFTRNDNLQYNYTQGSNIPYVIASVEQFLNIPAFNATNITSVDIRLINNISFENVDQSKLQQLQQFQFVGDLDGNGMTISGLRVSGSTQSQNTFGLFKQIGSFNYDSAQEEYQISYVRNLTLQVKEFAKSTSTFTGILSGVIVNTSLINVSVEAENFTVLGRNVVGGIAGAILGESVLYNVSTNVGVEASYLSHESNGYHNGVVSTWNNSWLYRQNEVDENGDVIDILSKLSNSNRNVSYAGGIAGVIDIVDKSVQELQEDDISINYDDISTRRANVNLTSVSGAVSITAEKVGGLFGYAGADVYLANSQFIVKDNDSQRFNAYYTAGGLIGENYGVIYLSLVEVEAKSANNFDQDLTNKTGNNLFNSSLTNPVYIGGLIGENYGGYISTSYSKTNVIHNNAKYAGGLVGYATNNGKTSTDEDFRPTKLVEVYTTGNVFAGSNYTIELISSDEEHVYQTGTANNIAGGLFGLYQTNDIAEITSNLTGVVGLSGYYKPNGYTLPTERNDNGLTYSDIAKGFVGTVELSNGKLQQTTYNATLGAFAGQISVDSSSDVAITFNLNGYNYIYSLFVYNGASITINDCVKANGKVINMVASGSTTFSNYNHYTDLNQNQNIIIANTVGNNSKSESAFTISANNAYLVFRSQNVLDSKTGINYANYKQDMNGIFQNWQILSWAFNQPVYPKIIQGDTTGYIDIKTESDLRNIRNDHRIYRLVGDIYLSNYHTQISTFNGTFISAKRDVETDGVGINGSEYYAIYNININDENTNGNVGFFQSLTGTIQNINFVFGTDFSSPQDIKDGKTTWIGPDVRGISVSENSNLVASRNIGSVAGSAKNAIINNCHVYFQTDSAIAVNAKAETLSVGGLIGNAETSTITGTYAYANIVQNSDAFNTVSSTAIQNSQNNLIQVSGSGNTLNVGGNIGYLIGSKESSMANCFVNMEASGLLKINVSDINFATANVGGYIGLATNNLGVSLNQNIKTDISAKGNTNSVESLNIGGLIATADGATADLTTEIETNISSSMASNIQNVGGLVANIQTNGATLNGGTIKATISMSQTVNGTGSDNSEQGALNVGGAIGYASDLIAKEIKVEKATISFNAYSVTNSTRIGGFAGQLESGTINNSVANNIEISFANTVSAPQDLYVGGFAGTGKFSAENCYAGGEISTDSTFSATENLYGGFVGEFQRTPSTIKNCISDVKIQISQTSDKLSVNAFAGQAGGSKVQIIKCLALGDIVYANGLFTGKASGFVNNVTSEIRNSYSLSSLKLVTNSVSNDNITTDYFNTSYSGSVGIYYNYNLSGSVNYKTNNNQDYISLATNAQSVFKNSEDDFVFDNIVLTNYFNTTNKTLLVGTKINPIVLEAEGSLLSKPNLLPLTSNKYYVLNSDYNFALENINANIIGNNMQSANKLIIRTTPQINDSVMISGIEFVANNLDSSPIAVNNGYIFNCITTGNISANNSQVAGFVGENNGLINGSGTITEITETGTTSTISGFVHSNNGYIANSFANGIIHNLAQNGIYAGFVNTTTGRIINSYASTSMFNVNTSTNSSIVTTYGFTPFEIDNISNGYYDYRYGKTNIIDRAERTLSRWWSDLSSGKSSTENYLFGIKVAQTGNRYINYNLPVYVSFAESNLVTGSVSTTNRLTTEQISIKNSSQLENYINNYSTKNNVIIDILADIDMSSAGALKGISNYNTSTTTNSITLQNSKTIRTLYGVKLEVPEDRNSIGFVSSNNVTISNIGFVAKFEINPISDKTNVGLLVGIASKLTATNSYVKLTQEVRLSRVSNFGVFAGFASDVQIDTAFAMGNAKILAITSGTTASDNYYGGFIGKTSNSSCKVSNIFASGELSIAGDISSTKSTYVGGLFGSLSGSLTNSYANVSIINNVATDYRQNTHVGAVCGISDIYFIIHQGQLQSSMNVEQAEEYIKQNISDLFMLSNKNSSQLVYSQNNELYIDDSTKYEVTIYDIENYLVGKRARMLTTSVLYDSSISLVDKYVGKFTGNLATDVRLLRNNLDVSNVLFNYNPFEISYYDYSQEHHFPIQDVFKTSIIEGILEVTSEATIATKLSPTALSETISQSNVQYGGVYYLTEDVVVDTADMALNNVTIYGQGHAILTNSSNSNLESQTYIFASASNTILSNFNAFASDDEYLSAQGIATLDASGPVGGGANMHKPYLFGEIRNTYIGKAGLYGSILATEASNSIADNVSVSISKDVTINSGLIETASGNIVLLDCQVVTAEDIIISTSEQATQFGGLISNWSDGNSDSNCYVQSAKVSVQVRPENTTQTQKIGGLFATDKNANIFINRARINLIVNPYIMDDIKFVIGGIASEYNFNITFVNHLINSISVQLLHGNKNTNDDSMCIGLMYGQIIANTKANCTIDIPEIANKSMTIKGSKYNTISVGGVAGSIFTGSTTSTCNFTYSGEQQNTDSVNLNITANTYAKIHIGGFIGKLGTVNGEINKITLNNMQLTNKLVVNLNQNATTNEGTAFVGGLVGHLGYGRIAMTNCSQTGDVNVIDYATKSQTYVGGIAGYAYSSQVLAVTSTGLVGAMSYATSALNTTSVSDVRTESGTNTVNIPLVVGGAYGWYVHQNDANLSSVTKTQGSVRALLVGDNSGNGLSSSVEAENIQARAGSFAGIVSGTTKAITNSFLYVSTGTNEETSLNMNENIDNKYAEEAINRNGGLSTSSITVDNIFTNTTSDTVRDLTNSGTGNARMDKATIYYAVGFIHYRTESPEFEASNSMGDSVFAGYVYDGQVYNRSFWMNCTSFWSETYENNLIYSYREYTLRAKQHWAGHYVGAYVS